MLFKELFGRDLLKPIAQSHDLYHCYFDISGEAVGRRNNAYNNYRDQMPNTLEGIFINGRLVVLYSEKNIGAGWDRLKSGWSLADIHLGVNIFVYALRQRGGLAMTYIDNSTSPYRTISENRSHNEAYDIYRPASRPSPLQNLPGR